MLALECASQLTCRLNLLYEPIGDADVTAVGEALDKGGACRCPGSSRDAVPAAVEALVKKVRGRRDDELLAIWAEARDQVARCTSAPQRLWLVQHARRSLSREALNALLDIDRSQTLALIGSAEVVDATRAQRALGLCDSHLHSGAADELGDLLARLVPRVVEDAEPRELTHAVGQDARGVPLNLAPLVLALAAACTLLDGPDECSDGHERQLMDDAWWRAVSDAALAGLRIDAAQFRTLRHPLQEIARVRGFVPQLKVLDAALRTVAKGAPLSKAKSRTARRGLIALAALYALVTVPHESNLGSFVTRFETMGRLRDLFGSDEGRLASALYTMYVEGDVTAVELRKSLPASCGRTVSVARILGAIEADVEEHAAAAADACESVGCDELLVRMPLTFTRRDARPVDVAAEPDGYVPFRAPVGETLAAADAIVWATRSERVSRFVGAVDVVGDEKKVPNWLYAIAYARIAEAQAGELEFACHAGEYFANQLEGLRRIAEVALFQPVPVRRIGHCLALDADRGVDNQRTEEAGTLLESAIWSLLVMEGAGEVGLGQPRPPEGVPPRLLTELRRTVLRLADLVFGSRRIKVDDARRWYLDRFDLAAMTRWLPDLAISSHATLGWPRGRDRQLLPRAERRLDAMLLTTVYRMAVDVRTSSGVERLEYDPSITLPADVVEKARALLAEASDLAVAPVRRWLTSNEIVIEACPSSNAALAKLAIDAHPIWRFHNDHRLLCSVNTDDPTLFGASLSEEYVHAGMVAHLAGGDAGAFVAVLGDVSRSHGKIQRPLCNAPELPVDVYRELARQRA